MRHMNAAQPLDAPAGLLPLSRPLMTGEVLDAAFRLFRAGLLRCLPYSGLAVLVLELPSLYMTYVFTGLRDAALEAAGYFLVLLLTAGLLGLITLRMYAVSRGDRPRFRSEARTVLRRWPNGVIATLGGLGFPLLLFGLAAMFNNVLPGEAWIVVAVPLLWPTALFVVALPAFWCDRLGPFAAIARAVKLSRRRSWRMAGAILATACMVAVFYLLSIVVVAMMSPLLGRADLFLIATVRSMLTFVVGAFGIPFVVAVLIVAYEDLKLRDAEHRGAAA
jgi:hypothetical protein